MHERSFRKYFLKLYKNIIDVLTCSAGPSDVYNNNVKGIPTFDFVVITNDDLSSLSYNNYPFCRRSISLHFYSLIIFFFFFVSVRLTYTIYMQTRTYTYYIYVHKKKIRNNNTVQSAAGSDVVLFVFCRYLISFVCINITYSRNRHLFKCLNVFIVQLTVRIHKQSAANIY